MPLYLALPGLGRLGRVGAIDVDAQTMVLAYLGDERDNSSSVILFGG